MLPAGDAFFALTCTAPTERIDHLMLFRWSATCTRPKYPAGAPHKKHNKHRLERTILSSKCRVVSEQNENVRFVQSRNVRIELSERAGTRRCCGKSKKVRSRLRQAGDRRIVQGLRGRRPNRKISERLQQGALRQLRQARYVGVGPDWPPSIWCARQTATLG
jgi:hypothetical protein